MAWEDHARDALTPVLEEPWPDQEALFSRLSQVIRRALTGAASRTIPLASLAGSDACVTFLVAIGFTRDAGDSLVLPPKALADGTPVEGRLQAAHEVLSGVYEKAADARAKRLDSLKAILAEKDENATDEISAAALQTHGGDRLKQMLRVIAEKYPDAVQKAQAGSKEAAAAQKVVEEAQLAEQEKEWSKPPEGFTRAVTNAESQDTQALLEEANAVPVRLTANERRQLNLLMKMLHVSTYTDDVDIYGSADRGRRMAQGLRAAFATLGGMVYADNVEKGTVKSSMRGEFGADAAFFQRCCEIGRRYKILNPERMRSDYGKLLWMLQDSVLPQINNSLELPLPKTVTTVGTWMRFKRGGSALLQDPLLVVAVSDIDPVGMKRDEITEHVANKKRALKELQAKYAETAAEPEALTAADVELVVESLGDHRAFLRESRTPVEKLLGFLGKYFEGDRPAGGDLAIHAGHEGSKLSHSHRTQFLFVKQSLLLWREIMENLFQLWHLTEADLLDNEKSYRLVDTGQGLNRLQAAPRVSKAMHRILHRVQSECGGWVGLSVVHLGDRDVPNALFFIDKYLQVPRILGPLVNVVESLDGVCAENERIRGYVEKAFGSPNAAKLAILRDFFRHGFDGSGDDGGSCVDGRLTSTWNWCSRVEKKAYFNVMLLCGFTGFDGSDW